MNSPVKLTFKEGYEYNYLQKYKKHNGGNPVGFKYY